MSESLRFWGLVAGGVLFVYGAAGIYAGAPIRIASWATGIGLALIITAVALG